MRVRYGTYKLGIAASEISISSDQTPNATGRPVAAEVIWAIKTRIKNPTGRPKDFPAILNAFERAFSIHGQDLVLEFLDGTPSHHSLLSRNCVGGTRITRFATYATGRKGQYVNFRDVEVEIRGTVPLPSLQYLSFSETIVVRGGGAKFGIREVNVGPGVRQRLRTHTTCTATQSGSAVGYLVQPSPPPPIWPSWLLDEYPEVSVVGPQTVGEGVNAFLTNYQINWSWQFAAPMRLFGQPHYLTGR